MEFVEWALLDCSVGGGKVAAGGGAVFVDSKAQLVVVVRAAIWRVVGPLSSRRGLT